MLSMERRTFLQLLPATIPTLVNTLFLAIAPIIDSQNSFVPIYSKGLSTSYFLECFLRSSCLGFRLHSVFYHKHIFFNRLVCLRIHKLA
uniref:Putative secreted protein n=1 Tax=Panstrongylus lignarius TaxID=156445 RepID=A0A224Y478_9HEMI